MKHPKSLSLEWKTGEKNLPKEMGIYAVCCQNKKTKEIWYSFAEFIPQRFPNAKIDYDYWRVLGIFGDCFARKSTEDWFKVIAWSKTKKSEEKRCPCSYAPHLTPQQMLDKWSKILGWKTPCVSYQSPSYKCGKVT